jgi:arabinogalactan endo-1,4-beta-galactosidase
MGDSAVTMNRRGVLTTSAAAAGVSFLAAGQPTEAAPRRTFRNSLCASQFAEGVFAKGITFRAGATTARTVEELQRLMIAYGSTEVFARLGSRLTDPNRSEANQGMTAALERARLAKRLGIPLNPELLLCAYYGDESGQPEPDFSDYPQIHLKRPWRELTIEEICDAVRIYGELAARQILDTGVTVSVWDIGNEVDLGIAGVALRPFSPAIARPGWSYQPPDGVDPEIGKMTVANFFKMSTADQIAWGKQHLWGHVGSVLAAMAEGIRKADPKARFATHVGGLAVQTPEVFVAMYEAIEANGFRTEALGASFYASAYQYFPINPGVDRLVLYKQTAELTKKRLGKPIYIAEFGYAAGPMNYGAQSWANPVEGYPVTVEGQAAFYRDVVTWGVRNGTMAGVRPWAPDFVGGGWQGMALFDAPVGGVSVARPALGAIQDGLRRARA